MTAPRSDSEAVLWISLFLIVVVLTHQYASVVKGMLFDPGYWKGAQSGTGLGGGRPNIDRQLVPGPDSGAHSSTSPPSSEGFFSRVPAPGAQLNTPPTVPPGWQNPFGQP